MSSHSSTTPAVTDPLPHSPGKGQLISPPGEPGNAVSIRRAGLTAGIALLVLAALSAIGVLVAVDGLVTPGDAAKTAANITAAETRFRLGVASLYLVVVLDIIAAWALFRFFAPVHPWLSRLTAWLRVAYSGVFLAAISQLAAVPALLNDPGHQAMFGEQQLQAHAMLKLEAFHHTWMAALLLFGAHLALLGYLAYRSGYVPRLVSVALVIAGAGYAFDTFSSVLSADPIVISTYTALGELVLAIWLVMRGGRIHLGAGHDA